MKPNSTDKANGWPPLVRDVKGLRVRLRRQCQTGFMVLPEGTEGVLEGATAWHRLRFRSDPCGTCGVAGRIAGLIRNDLEVIRDGG